LNFDLTFSFGFFLVIFCMLVNVYTFNNNGSKFNRAKRELTTELKAREETKGRIGWKEDLDGGVGGF